MESLVDESSEIWSTWVVLSVNLLKNGTGGVSLSSTSSRSGVVECPWLSTGLSLPVANGRGGGDIGGNKAEEAEFFSTLEWKES